MLEASDILTFMEIENVRKKRDFIKRVTPNTTKQKVFNDRFFDGLSFTTSAHECGISEAMAKHYYKSVIRDIEAYMYMQDRIQYFIETGDNKNIVITALPISSRIKNICSLYFYLHEITELTEEQFWRFRKCGQKSLDEVNKMLAKFDLKFKNYPNRWEKIYGNKE